MSLIIAAVGVVLLTAPAIVARLHVDPASQVRLACTAASAGMWTLAVGVVLTASPLVMRWHDGAEIDAAAVSHVSPGGRWAWAAAAMVAGAGVAWGVGSLRRSLALRHRARLPRWAADTCIPDAHAGAEVRLADTATPLAFAVPGRDKHVVITRGLVEQLPADQLRAVLAHEGAHLRLRHDRHLLVLETYQRLWGWLPGVDGVVRAHRDAIERWADTDATWVRSLPVEACMRARTTLAQQTTDPRVKQPIRGWPVALAWTVLALIGAAGVYATTHVVGDVSAIVASLH